jgi:hypothetical protein
MRPALLVILLLGACQDRRASSDTAPARPSTPAAAPPAAATPEPAGWTTEQQACVDRWLAARKLDPYGSPQGTMYTGGTPLFDEATGRSTTRQSYLARNRPEALAACGVAP